MIPNFKFRSIKNGVESTMMIPLPSDASKRPTVVKDTNTYATQADLLLKENTANKVQVIENGGDAITYPSTAAVAQALAEKADSVLIKYGELEENAPNTNQKVRIKFSKYYNYYKLNKILILQYSDVELNIPGESALKISGYALLTQATESQLQFTSIVKDAKDVELAVEFLCDATTQSGYNEPIIAWKHQYDTIITADYLKDSNAIKIVGIWG